MENLSKWCQTRQCFSCTYTRCTHPCHRGQLEPIAPEHRDRAARQASTELTAYFATSTSWRGFGHAIALAEMPA